MEISIKLHKCVFSIEIIKVQVLYFEDVCNICIHELYLYILNYSLIEIYH